MIMGTKLDRRPDAVLRRIGAGGTTATVNRILRTWDRRTASDLESGARWYGDDITAILDAMVAAGAPSREHAAAVFSHLSPRTDIKRNIAGAMALVTRGAEACRRETGCMEQNVSKAAWALASDTPLDTFAPTAPKTSAFARNLLGDREAVTVDVWAARVALGEVSDDPEKTLAQVGVYDAVSHAFRLAARRAGVDPTTMQATTWITARGGRAW